MVVVPVAAVVMLTGGFMAAHLPMAVGECPKGRGLGGPQVG